MNQNLKKTLTELENNDWGDPQYTSEIITKCYQLRKKPLLNFTKEDFRLMLGQNISLEHLVPIALSHLENDPLTESGLYSGDLLVNILRLNPVYWDNYPQKRIQLETILQRVMALPQGLDDTTDDTLNYAIKAYLCMAYALHECQDFNNYLKPEYLNYSIYRLNNTWRFQIRQRDIEKAVLANNSPFEAKEICNYSLIIHHCPFCGTKLTKNSC